MKKILKGFTLAEVLITLGIIGVVAAVTLPSLQVNVNKQALGTQLAKAYSQISEGFKMYMTNEGLDELDRANFDADSFANKYLQVQYVCTSRGDTNCFASTYTTISSGKQVNREPLVANALNATDHGYILRDGTVVYISNASFVVFDVNNKKGPNKVGYDYHVARINSDGSIGPSIDSAFKNPDKRSNEINNDLEKCKNGTGDYSGGAGCFAYLLKNNFKLDY